MLHHSRRDRRRATLLRARTAADGGLETEAWHAKRFEMTRIFGLRLPWRASDRAEASAVRAANEGCVLHDASYWLCVHLTGGQDAVLALLERTTDAPAALLTSRLRHGREVCCTLHCLDACPAMAIGSVRLLPCHPTATADAAMGTSASAVAASCGVWLFVHAAAASHARGALRDAATTLGGVNVARARPLLRFQLRGPTSHTILTNALCLKHHEEQTALHPPASPAPAGTVVCSGGGLGRAPPTSHQVATASSNAWQSLSSLSSPVTLPPGVMLGVTVMHPDSAPHPVPPPRRSEDVANRAFRGGAARELRELVVSWPPSLAASALFESESDGEAAAASAAVSVLLVQQPSLATDGQGSISVARQRGGRRGGRRGSGRVSENFGGGWDLLLPAGSSAGRAVWRALLMAGARAIGQSELRAIHLHADTPLFPYDAPDTLAGLKAELSEAQKRYAAHARRPPSRRPNHTALRVAQPFGCDFAGLLGVPRKEVPARSAVAEAEGAPDEEVGSSAAAMQFGVLRGQHAAAVWAASPPTRAMPSAEGGGSSPSDTQQQPSLPPLLRTLLPRMLLRVALHFPAKGCARAPASVFAPRPEDVRAFLAARDNGAKAKPWGGTTLLTRGDAALPAGLLVGFVSHGGYNRLLGHGTALTFVAAAPFCELLRGSAHVGRGEVLVLARNPWSRQFRPALAQFSC